MHQSRIDKLIQYIVVSSSDLDDWKDKYIGPIHIIKLLYLADLAYSETHNGTTYTGIDWIFYHFGPWSQAAYERIPNALLAIGANHIRESKTSGESDRWKFDYDDEYSSQTKYNIEKELDFFATSTINKHLKEFGTDTYRLLHFVYRTSPMLSAAPKEPLKFPTSPPEKSDTTKILPQTLSVKQQKKKKDRRTALQKELHERLNRKFCCDQSIKQVAPRYDDIFFKGIAALDDIQLDDLPNDKFTCSVDDSVWKSKARYDSDDLS